MTPQAPQSWYPPIDEKIPPEVHTHLRLIYDRIQNHATAVTNLQNQIDALQKQLNGGQ